MQIDKNLCVGCGTCVPYCPGRAISVQGGKAIVNLDECVECGSCLRLQICPRGVFYQQDLQWPRVVRKVMSDPLSVFEGTGVSGRGTEEMKTNDVTNRFKPGFVGIGVEIGRPLVGTRFSEVEKVAKVLAQAGVEFEDLNPVTRFMADPKKGTFKPEILNEKVLSAILECIVPVEKLLPILYILDEVAKDLNTVFSVEVISRCGPKGEIPHEEVLRQAGFWISNNVKTNLGLGRANV